jgi:predicted transcriptional regulator
MVESVKFAIYAGSNGNTQGDKKDNKPAVKANAIEIFSNFLPPFNKEMITLIFKDILKTEIKINRPRLKSP